MFSPSSYRKLMERAFRRHGGYTIAKQFMRARKVLKSLKTMVGHVLRDVERKLSDAAIESHKGTMILAELTLAQKRTTKGKFYSLHRPEMECITKGKTHRPYKGVPQHWQRTVWFVLSRMLEW